MNNQSTKGKSSGLTDNLPDFVVDTSSNAPKPNQQFLDFLSSVNISLDTDLIEAIGESSPAPTHPKSPTPKSAPAPAHLPATKPLPTPSNSFLAAAKERSAGKTKKLPPKLAPQTQISGFVENFDQFFEGEENEKLRDLLGLLTESQGGVMEMASDRRSGSEGESEKSG